MGMSNAERQRQYRQRQRTEGNTRLNIAIGAATKHMLERLATCYGVTLRDALALALDHTEGALLDTLSRPERDAYWTGKLALRRNGGEGTDEPLRHNGEPVMVETSSANGPLRRNGNAADQGRDARIIRLFTEGTSKRAIARELGIADGTVRNVLKRHQAHAAPSA